MLKYFEVLAALSGEGSVVSPLSLWNFSVSRQTSFLPIYSTALPSHLNIHKFMLIPLSYSITQYGFCQLVSVQDAPLDTHLACRCIELVLCWWFFVWSVLMFSVYLEHFMALILYISRSKRYLSTWMNNLDFVCKCPWTDWATLRSLVLLSPRRRRCHPVRLCSCFLWC